MILHDWCYDRHREEKEEDESNPDSSSSKNKSKNPLPPTKWPCSLLLSVIDDKE